VERRVKEGSKMGERGGIQEGGGGRGQRGMLGER